MNERLIRTKFMEYVAKIENRYQIGLYTDQGFVKLLSKLAEWEAKLNSMTRK